MIARRALAHALGRRTASQARADRRGQGPGRPIHVSATLVVYDECELSAWLAARARFGDIAVLDETLRRLAREQP